jgi:transcriptional regulator of acetoin/glycerol metabolism
VLLRVLQEREVRPVGGDRALPVDLRVVAATLRDLDRAVADSAFRHDLHARLRGHVVTLLPLRDRREDLGWLISALLKRVADRSLRFDPEALRALLRYHWPDNVRELEQALETASALTDGDVIRREHLPARLRDPSLRAIPANDPVPIAELDPEDLALRAQLEELLEIHAGNVAAVAKALGKQRAQIYKWSERLGIDLSRFRK